MLMFPNICTAHDLWSINLYSQLGVSQSRLFSYNVKVSTVLFNSVCTKRCRKRARSDVTLNADITKKLLDYYIGFVRVRVKWKYILSAPV